MTSADKPRRVYSDKSARERFGVIPIRCNTPGCTNVSFQWDKAKMKRALRRTLHQERLSWDGYLKRCYLCGFRKHTTGSYLAPPERLLH